MVFIVEWTICFQSMIEAGGGGGGGGGGRGGMHKRKLKKVVQPLNNK